MTQSAQAAVAHAAQAIANAKIRDLPFPHIYVEEIFPTDFYTQMRAMLPAYEAYERLLDTGRVGQAYSSARLVLMPDEASIGELAPAPREFWQELFDALLTEEFARVVMTCFADAIAERFANGDNEAGKNLFVTWESFLIRDRASYALGPHTDSPRKLVSMLFYMARDTHHPDLGTSFYAPVEPGFVCPGGPHHSFEGFRHLGTLPYVPNTLAAFPKSNQCFHGVEPVADGFERDLLFFDLKQGER
jgi:hypothetical protein